MKRIIKSFVLVAAAATALVSCEKNDIDNSSVNSGIKFSIKGQFEETRTFIEQNDKIYTPKWHKGDEIGVFFGGITSGTKADATFANSAEDGAIASFDGTSAKAADEGTLKAIYPATAIYQGYADGTIGVELNAIQAPTASSFDAKADILVSATCDYCAEGGEVAIDDMYFSRIMSVVKINLESAYAAVQGQTVKKVKMTADATLTGRARVDFDSRAITEWTTKNNDVSASYDKTDYVCINTADNNSVYLVVNPTTITAGSNIVFDITTENFEIRKEIQLANDIVFPKGDIAVINLTILEANCTAKEPEADFTGDWVIYGTADTYTYAALKYESGNNIKGTAIKFDGVKLIPTDTEKINDAKMHIEKITGGDYDGLYTILDAGGKYICTASGGNRLKGEATPSVNSYWEITEKDGEYSITAIKSDYNKVMQYNPNNGNPLFACYASASQKAVKLYPWANVDIPSEIKADDTIEVGAAGKEAELTEYTTQGIDAGATISATCDGTVVYEAAIDDKCILYSFTSNYGTEAREGSITLTLASDETVKKEITVKQAGSKLTVSTAEITIPATDDEFEGSFTVTSDVFSGTIVSDNTNEDEIMIGTTFEAGETSIEVFCFAEAADEEQTIATLTVSRTENDPQAKTIVIKKAAKGALEKLEAPAGITVSGISAKGFTATWNNVEGAAGYAYKVTATEAADADAATAIAEGEATATTATITAELTEGETYYLYIKSLGEEGVSDNSAWSQAVEVEVPNAKQPVTVTMNKFTNVNADNIDGDTNVYYSTAQGGAGTAPGVYSNEIRLYQGTPGGNITISAKAGYKIQAATIGSSMKTSIKYAVDGGAQTPNTAVSLTANNKYSVNNINASSVTFHCYGGDKNSRLYVNYLSVTYIAE